MMPQFLRLSLSLWPLAPMLRPALSQPCATAQQPGELRISPLSLLLSLSLFFSFSLSAQNVTIKKNANNDHLIWPLNSSQSIYIGDGSGSVSTGLFNTGIGAFALNLNSSASSNTAIGNVALAKVTTGGLNTAMGVSAMYENLTGTENTAIGFSSLYNNKGRGRSTAMGYKAMYYANNATGAGSTFNTAVGYEALNGSPSPGNNTGVKNVAMGDQVMYSNTSGSNNTANGFNALYSNSLGSTNAAFGASTLYSNTTGFSNVAIGNLALYSNTIRTNLVAVGDSALYKNGIGVTQFFEAVGNTAIGSKVLAVNTTGYQNTGLGNGALFKNITGAHNTGLGAGALYNNLSGDLNTAIGSRSLLANNTGAENTVIGYSVMQLNTSGSRNVSIGKESLYSNQTGNNNVSVGYEAGRTTTGTGNVFLGYKAGRNETGDNKLYISNSEADPTQALIYGDFYNKEIYMNGVLQVTHSQTTQAAISGIKSYPAGFCLSSAGVYGQNTVEDACGIGVSGKGGQYGVFGECLGTSSGEYTAVQGQATGTNSGINFGLRGIGKNASANFGGYGEATSTGAGVNLNFGLKGIASGAVSQNLAVFGSASGNSGSKYGGSFSATGTGDNYGITASASGGSNNYAAWFSSGGVWVTNTMGVGQAPNNYQLSVKHALYGLQIQSQSAGSTFWEMYQSPAVSGNLMMYASTNPVGNFNYASGVYSGTSDRRLKENIQPMNPVLAGVMKLQADNYTYKSDPDHKPCFGFIAQDVEPLFPQLVTLPTHDSKGDTPYMLNYSGFGVLAIKAIQEQQAIIEAQKAVNDAQEERIARLEELVQELLSKTK